MMAGRHENWSLTTCVDANRGKKLNLLHRSHTDDGKQRVSQPHGTDHTLHSKIGEKSWKELKIVSKTQHALASLST